PRSPICATGTSTTSRRRKSDPSPHKQPSSRQAQIRDDKRGVYRLLAVAPVIWPAGGRTSTGVGAGSMAASTDQRSRSGNRVVFERGIPAHMMGIDGTWRRDCTMEDVSETGAKLTVEGSVEGLHLKEFFLLLSSTGLAYRRCELAWVNGDQIGVNFLKAGDRKKVARRAAADA